MARYRVFIASDDNIRREFAHKGYHFQFRADSFPGVWELADYLIEQYDNRLGVGSVLTNGIRRDLRVKMLAGSYPFCIGHTQDNRAILVQKVPL